MKIYNVEKTNMKSGSCLQGYMTATYDELVDKFGEPYKAEQEGGFDKVWTEWNLMFDTDEGLVYATIYDWKENGPYVAREANSYRWHVGGFDYEAEEAVQTALLDYLAKAV